MAQAEYEAQSTLSHVIPDIVVLPETWSTFDNGSRAFIVTPFRRLDTRPPVPHQLIDILKRLHQTSASPTGKFGFHTTTYWGPAPMVNDWADSWEEFYARQFRSDVAYLLSVYGPDSVLSSLTDLLVDKVIARLLRPLQTGGRSIKPALCHGDIWDGNVQ